MNGPSASRRAPRKHLTWSFVEPTNKAAAVMPCILCRSPGEDGTTYFGAPIARCSRIVCCRLLGCPLLRIAGDLSRYHGCGFGLRSVFQPFGHHQHLSLLNDFVPDNVLSIVHEQASRIASNSGSALSTGMIVGILASLWSAMSGVKAMIDALNVIYEQKETRSFIKLNLVALAFTLAALAAFLLAIACIILLPLILSLIGLGSLAQTLTRVARWPVLLMVLLVGLACSTVTARIAALRVRNG